MFSFLFFPPAFTRREYGRCEYSHFVINQSLPGVRAGNANVSNWTTDRMKIPQTYGCELSDKVAAAPMQPEDSSGGTSQPVATAAPARIPRNGAISGQPVTLRLLALGHHFVRRPRGGWRLGARILREDTAVRLIARGLAEIADDRLQRRSKATP
ncbi:hypothetical protein [Bradyrhizobium elkanii]|uniref:hypothetical protein n=1 Tax=Bradyrhizobium elkanii TaxID=29448 RepID=UPI00114D0E6F|nr:hypothetical protein [Bradyrhizobium elkanii]